MKPTIPTFISHYYEQERGPLLSITDHDRETAREIIRQITARNEGFSNNRPPKYIDWRIDVENWLRTAFIEKGGKPIRQNPHYFVLGDCDWLLSWYKNGGILKKNLADIDPDQMTFTYPDSMVSYQLYQYYLNGDNPYYKDSDHKEYHGNVFRFDELEKTISTYGMPEGKTINGVRTSDELYIEIQVWSDLK